MSDLHLSDPQRLRICLENELFDFAYRDRPFYINLFFSATQQIESCSGTWPEYSSHGSLKYSVKRAGLGETMISTTLIFHLL